MRVDADYNGRDICNDTSNCDSIGARYKRCMYNRAAKLGKSYDLHIGKDTKPKKGKKILIVA